MNIEGIRNKQDKLIGIKITYVNKNGIKQRIKLSLKKILVTGLIAIGIAIAAKHAAKEASFQLEKVRIENLKENADEIAGLKNNTTIVDGKEVKIADKIIELAEKREDYNNAKHEKSSKKELESLKDEIMKVEEEFQKMALNETKEQATPFFENIDGTTLTVKRENNPGKQNDYIVQEKVITEGLNQTRVEVNSYELDNEFTGNVISGNTDKAIEQMPEFLQEGLELSEDGRTLR